MRNIFESGPGAGDENDPKGEGRGSEQLEEVEFKIVPNRNQQDKIVAVLNSGDPTILDRTPARVDDTLRQKVLEEIKNGVIADAQFNRILEVITLPDPKRHSERLAETFWQYEDGEEKMKKARELASFLFFTDPELSRYTQIGNDKERLNMFTANLVHKIPNPAKFEAFLATVAEERRVKNEMERVTPDSFKDSKQRGQFEKNLQESEKNLRRLEWLLPGKKKVRKDEKEEALETMRLYAELMAVMYGKREEYYRQMLLLKKEAAEDPE